MSEKVEGKGRYICYDCEIEGVRKKEEELGKIGEKRQVLLFNICA